MAHRTEARGERRWSAWRELPLLVVVALALALLIKAFVVQSFRIPSGSMEDTLRIGDWVLVNKMVYHLRGVDRGDIVVFNGRGSWDPPARGSSPGGLAPRLYHDALRWVGLETEGTDYIKRVIGLPGDHVMCCDSDGRITVNGVPLSERSYLYPGSDPSVQQFKIVVPSGRVWVMGDHRADSADSRYHMRGPGDGTIPLNQVVGRAFVVFWPLSQLQSLSIPTTFKQAALHSPRISAAVHRSGVPADAVSSPAAGGAAAGGAAAGGAAAGGAAAGGAAAGGAAAGGAAAGGIAAGGAAAGGAAPAVLPAATPAVPRAGTLGVVAPGLWLRRRFRRIPHRGNARRGSAARRICHHSAVSVSRIPPGQRPKPGHRRRCGPDPGISSFRWTTSSCHASLRWRSHPSPAASRRPRRRSVTEATTRLTLRIRGMSR